MRDGSGSWIAESREDVVSEFQLWRGVPETPLPLFLFAYGGMNENNAFVGGAG